MTCIGCDVTCEKRAMCTLMGEHENMGSTVLAASAKRNDKCSRLVIRVQTNDNKF